MIKLYDLLTEQVNAPKAIILAGAPGAGKGYVLSGLDLSNLKILNVDNTYIDLLKKANVSLDLKNASPEDRSEAAKAMAAANKEFKGKVADTIQGKESFVLDGTAASYKQTAELKQQLEEAGYKVAMLYVYTDLERSLKQNQDRFDKSGGEDRSLSPAIVMRTWKSVTDNLDPYFDLFSPHFIAVANTLEGDKIDNVEDIIKKYLDPYKPTGTKPKTPAQQKRSEEQKAELNAAIQTMLSSEFNDEVLQSMISKEEAQLRIAQFLRS